MHFWAPALILLVLRTVGSRPLIVELDQKIKSLAPMTDRLWEHVDVEKIRNKA